MVLVGEPEERSLKLLCERLMACAFDRQITEFRLRAVLLTRLGPRETLRIA